MKTKRTILAISLATVATLSIGVASASFLGVPLPETLFGEAKTNDQSVTGNLNQVTAKEAIDWLKSKGLNFVIDTTDIPADRKVTINLSNVSGEDAVKAVAKALGLNYEMEGKTYVLRPESNFRVWRGEMSEADKERLQSELKGRVRVFTDGNSEQWEKEMEEFGKRMEQWGEEFGKKFESMGKDGFKFELRGDGKEFSMDLSEIEKHLKDLKIPAMPNMPKLPRVMIQLPEIKKLLENLTPEQRAQMERDGEITLRDLTPGQREALGMKGDMGDVEITISKDGTRIRVETKGENSVRPPRPPQAGTQQTML